MYRCVDKWVEYCRCCSASGGNADVWVMPTLTILKQVREDEIDFDTSSSFRNNCPSKVLFADKLQPSNHAHLIAARATAASTRRRKILQMRALLVYTATAVASPHNLQATEYRAGKKTSLRGFGSTTYEVTARHCARRTEPNRCICNGSVLPALGTVGVQ